MVGVAARTFIHAVWGEPASRPNNLLPIAHYVLTQIDPNGNVANEEVPMYFTSGWAGPAAGHFITHLGGVALVPGQGVNVMIRACNSLGCGLDTAAVSLKTDDHVPGSIAAPTLTSNTASSITVGVGAAPAYTGGRPISGYELSIVTRAPQHALGLTTPAEISEVSVTLTGSLPLSHVVTARVPTLNYIFRVRALNELGEGAWSTELFTAAIPSPARDVTVQLIEGTTTTDAAVTWVASDGRGSTLSENRVTACDVTQPPTAEDSSLCGVAACTSTVLSAFAGTYSCEDHIRWRETPGGGGLSTRAACSLTAGEFPAVCGACAIPWPTCFHTVVLGSATQGTVSSLPGGKNYTVSVEAVNAVGSDKTISKVGAYVEV